MSTAMADAARFERGVQLQPVGRSYASEQLRILRTQRERPIRDHVLSGKLDQISIFSVLQTLSANTNTGNLLIDCDSHSGSLYVDRGQLVHASLGRHRGAKALYRLVYAEDGKFEFFSPGRDPSERNLAGSLEMHLIEAARHKDEMAVLREELPSGDTVLSFNKNMVASIAKIPYPMLEVMAAIHKNESIAAVLDGCTLPDLDVVKILLNLLKNKVVQCEVG